MSLSFGENVDEFLEISDTSASKKLQQLIIAVTWLYIVDNVFSLRPRDTSDTSKLSDKRIHIVNRRQHLNTIDSQLANMSCIQRSNVTILSSDICSSISIIINCTTPLKCKWIQGANMFSVSIYTPMNHSAIYFYKLVNNLS